MYVSLKCRYFKIQKQISFKNVYFCHCHVKKLDLWKIAQFLSEQEQ